MQAEPTDRPGPAAAEPAGGGAHTMVQSLVFAARRKGVDLSVGRIVHDHALGGGEPSLHQLRGVARSYGLKARATRLSWDDLRELGPVLPLVARLDNGNGIVILGTAEREGGPVALVVDPLADRPGIIELPRETLLERWSGGALLLKGGGEKTEGEAAFNLRWFLPEFLRQRRLFSEVLLAAVALSALALAVPLFFQLVIDRVLVHHSGATLFVLAVGVVIAICFESGFGFLRQYFLLFATRRIDMRLARRTFEHLLSLPVSFFEKRYAGVLAKHLQQTEKIRKFLTGRLLLTALDLVTMLVFLPVMYIYSGRLTLVVLLFTALIALIIALLIKPFRRRLRELYNSEGERQAFLVENLHGIFTVKSLALEPRQRRRWDDKAAAAVLNHHRVGIISAAAQNLTGLVQKLMLVAVIVLGARDVFAGELTIGALVAFQMFSGRVTGPLVAIVSLVNEYQETALSIKMLGEVMNARPERSRLVSGLRPDIRGAFSLEEVTFSYQGAGAPALRGLSLGIAEGSVQGVVGRSGSGKSTLAKLLQGLYLPQEGVVRLDGVDLRDIDIDHLRRGIGVVMQDSFLFRGTVRENIAITKADASLAQVKEAARLAGADEFIEQLPSGYDTFLEEGGVNLSGGQKQRLAIARALLTRPRILILDEATSALDPHSEAIVKRNLGEIAKGRTVVVISHRLSTLVDADAILVLERGRVVGGGTHRELLDRCQVYSELWCQQVGGAGEAGDGA